MSAPLLRLTAACLIALLLACAPWSTARAQVCTPQSSTGLNFGSLVGTPTVQTDTSGSITVTCTGGTVGTTVRACSYIGNGNPVTNKQMTSGANTLNFNVYSNAPGGTLYATRTNGTPPSQVYTVTAGTVTLNFPVFGRVFSGQTVASGTYTVNLATVANTVVPSSGVCPNGPNTPSINIAVQAVVGVACTLTANSIKFGTVTNLASTLNNNTGSLVATCSNGGTYTIALNAGTSVGNTILARKMSIGGNTAGVVSYQLYRDAGPANVWGNGTTGVIYSGTGNGLAQTIPVFAQVPAQSTPAAGTYSDTVTATITY